MRNGSRAQRTLWNLPRRGRQARARLGPSGEPITLFDQDRARWDRLLIRRGLAALERSEKAGGPRGPYALQAAIAACHARALSPEQTDWPHRTASTTSLPDSRPRPSWI